MQGRDLPGSTKPIELSRRKLRTGRSESSQTILFDTESGNLLDAVYCEEVLIIEKSKSTKEELRQHLTAATRREGESDRKQFFQSWNFTSPPSRGEAQECEQEGCVDRPTTNRTPAPDPLGAGVLLFIVIIWVAGRCQVLAHMTSHDSILQAPAARLLYSRKNATDLLSMSLRKLDTEIAEGHIQTLRHGGRVLITAAELNRYASPDSVKTPAAA